MSPPPDNTLVPLGWLVPKLTPLTSAVLLTTGPVGLVVPAAPPPMIMFPVATDTAGSQLALVFRQAELPTAMLPLAPVELAQRTRSEPLVWRVREAATVMLPKALNVMGEEVDPVVVTFWFAVMFLPVAEIDPTAVVMPLRVTFSVPDSVILSSLESALGVRFLP